MLLHLLGIVVLWLPFSSLCSGSAHTSVPPVCVWWCVELWTVIRWIGGRSGHERLMVVVAVAVVVCVRPTARRAHTISSIDHRLPLRMDACAVG